MIKITCPHCGGRLIDAAEKNEKLIIINAYRRGDPPPEGCDFIMKCWKCHDLIAISRDTSKDTTEP